MYEDDPVGARFEIVTDRAGDKRYLSFLMKVVPAKTHQSKSFYQDDLVIFMDLSLVKIPQ